MRRIFNSKFLLIIILSLALFLRSWNIGNNPPALYGDELTLSYDAYSILQTGKDHYGNFLPLVFQSSDGRPAGYVYFSIPFIILFGPSEIGARSLSVLSGVGIVFLLFYLGKKLISRKVGLVAAGIGALSPWDISLSRGGFETHFALFLSLLGVALFINYKKPIMIILSAICFALAMHTYPTYKLTLPLFAPILIWFTGGIKPLFSKKFVLYSGISLIILMTAVTIFVFQSFNRGSKDRFFSNNIFANKDLKQKIIQENNLARNVSSLPDYLSPWLHNSVTSYSLMLGESYIKYFSYDFLFLHGDLNPRHNMASMGGLFLIEVLAVILGLWSVVKEGARKTLLFLLLWLGISPVAASLLADTHALRSSFMLPPLILISASGLVFAFRLKGMYVLKVFIAVAFIIQFLILIERVYFLNPNQYSRFWSYPAKLAAETAIANKTKYDFIIMSERIDNISLAYAVYAKVPPNEFMYQSNNKTNLNGYSFKKFDNIYLGEIPEKNLNDFLTTFLGSVLYLGPMDESQNIGKYEVFSNLDKEPAFFVKSIK